MILNLPTHTALLDPPTAVRVSNRPGNLPASAGRTLASEVAAESLSPPIQVRLEQGLAERLGAERFDLWFAGKTHWSLRGQILELATANEFSANWMRTRFMEEITAVVQSTVGKNVRVQVTVDAEISGTSAGAAHLPHKHAVAGALAHSKPTVSHQPSNKPESLVSSTLNPRYTFDEFVVGSTNQMAYHAALRVADEPGQHFNPLFIHGSCGLGKTHLLQAICQRFSKQFNGSNGQPPKKWLYLTGEQFTNDFVEAIRTHKTEAFRKRIRSADLLIIDDVHFLAHKKATQEEFLHTFNQIDTSGKQVVLASDCPPKSITSMTEGLISRFVSGMVVRIDAPDLPTRLEILKRKVARNHWNVSDAMLMHLAQQPVSSVRELEGSLMQVVAGASLMAEAQPATGGMAENSQAMEQLRQRQAPGRAPVPVERIITAVAAHFDLNPTHLLGSSREKTISLARSVAMYLTRQNTAMSYPEIGRALGNKNHSTVIAACQRVEELIRGGDLICWQTRTNGISEARHQAIADLVHELGSIIRKK